jgi:hypothetical protein
MRSIAAARAFCNWRDNVTHVRKSLFVMVQMDTRLHRKILKRLLHVWRLATSESLYWTLHDLRVTPPPPRTKWTRRVPHPVLIGHGTLHDLRVTPRPPTLRPPVLTGHVSSFPPY